MKTPDFEMLDKLSKLWFNDNGTLKETMVDYMQNLIKGFLFGDDNIYYQRDRSEPCVKFLQTYGILESALTYEQLHRRGKERAMKKFAEMFNQPDVQKVFMSLCNTIKNLTNKIADKDLSIKLANEAIVNKN